MAILFQHLRDTKNIGDRWCSPFDWLEWPEDASVKDIRQAGPAYDVGIYGGGKIFGGLSTYPGITKSPDAMHIAWGVGTLQSFPFSRRYRIARQMCDLVGSRDWNDRRFTWAPCVSCMAPHFDSPGPPSHRVVFYFHGGKTAKQRINIPDDIPSLSNNAPSLDAALEFIASGETVVSNSYHGVYWALLMGRRALCIPFSNKFSSYRLPPAYAKPHNWMKKLDEAKAQPKMLDLCRAGTIAFYDRVRTALAQREGR